MRNLCKSCGKRPVAINYYKKNQTFYRSKCDHCIRKYKKERPLWSKFGYKKKTICDRCSFNSKFQEQFDVYYLDGNPTNNRYTNLKTVCANCLRLLQTKKFPWRQGDLRPDF